MNNEDINEIKALLAEHSTSWLFQQTGINRVTIWKLQKGKIKVENLTFVNGLKLLKVAQGVK